MPRDPARGVPVVARRVVRGGVGFDAGADVSRKDDFRWSYLTDFMHRMEIKVQDIRDYQRAQVDDSMMNFQGSFNVADSPDGANTEGGEACQHVSVSFDRTVCACGSMHDYCDDCGRAMYCPLEAVPPAGGGAK